MNQCRRGKCSFSHTTVEPPNKGHVGTRSFVLYREVSFIRRLKCTGIIGIGTSIFVLYREVFLFGVSFIGGSTVVQKDKPAKLLFCHIQVTD